MSATSSASIDDRDQFDDSPILYTHPCVKIVKFEFPRSILDSVVATRQKSHPSSLSRSQSSSTSISSEATEVLSTVPPPSTSANDAQCAVQSSSSSSRSSSDGGAGDHSNDIEIDAIASLPYHVLGHERTLSVGPLYIHHVPGSMAFMKADHGNVVKPLMSNSQCWCVSDGAASGAPEGLDEGQVQQSYTNAIFVIRVGKMAYYRIELPLKSSEDRIRVLELKRVLKGLVLFEETPCPFFRGSPAGEEAEVKVEERKRKKSVRSHRRPWTPKLDVVPSIPHMPHMGRSRVHPHSVPSTATTASATPCSSNLLPGPRHRAYSFGAYNAQNISSVLTVSDRIAAFEPQRRPRSAQASSLAFATPLRNEEQDHSTFYASDVPRLFDSIGADSLQETTEVAVERHAAEEGQEQSIEQNISSSSHSPVSFHSFTSETAHTPSEDRAENEGASINNDGAKPLPSTPSPPVETSASSTGIASEALLKGRIRPRLHALSRSRSPSSPPPLSPTSTTSPAFESLPPSPQSPSPSQAVASVSPSPSANSTTLVTLVLFIIRFAYRFAIRPPLHTLMLLVHLGAWMANKSSTGGYANEGTGHDT